MINPYFIIVTLWSTISVSAQTLQNSDLKRWTLINCSNNWSLDRTGNSLSSLSETAVNLTALVLPGNTFWLQLSGTLHSKQCPLYSNVLYKVTSGWQYKLMEVDDATNERFKESKRVLSVVYVYDNIVHNGRNESLSCYHDQHLIQLKGNYDYGFASCSQSAGYRLLTT
ncbi:unnamed protein product [Meganyctiphanes norvegica]|uniref:Uncharacterized protein n=1 Tax=Meganyctiphanes norvegica TaxID=48144 RepID=A0AAV2S8E5_MEGNR